MLSICLLIAAVVSAQAPAVVVRDAWVREAGVQSSTGAYFVLENRGATAVALVSAEVDGAGSVELHETKMTGDMMRMSKTERVDVPAGASVVFKPGGLHLMVFQLSRAFEPGRTAAITLRFADGRVIKVQASIRAKSEVRLTPEIGRVGCLFDVAQGFNPAGNGRPEGLPHTNTSALWCRGD